MLLIAAGMGKATRNEELAEYYLRAAGVAAVLIDADGDVGAQDVASVDIDPDRTVYCCERGVHFMLAYRLYEWKKALEVGPPVIAAKFDELADLGAIGLAPHQQLRIRYAGRKVFQIGWSAAGAFKITTFEMGDWEWALRGWPAPISAGRQSRM